MKSSDSFIRRIFLTCNFEWREYIRNYAAKEFKYAARQLYKICPRDKLIPRIDIIMRPFSICTPEQIRVVIIGQDPYPEITAAQGLSFSTESLRPSISQIFRCLKKSGYRIESDSGNLICWAKQGVLLLNSCLTKTVGDKTLHSFWQTFTSKILETLCLKYRLTIFAWGVEANSIAKNVASDSTKILSWSHPQAISGKPFEDCDHFTNTPEIDWNVHEHYDYIFACDGGAINNGKKNAKAGYGVAFAKEYKDHYRTHIVEKLPDISGRVEGETQTNNRGELLGLIYAIKAILDANKNNDKFLHCLGILDSVYTIDCFKNYMYRAPSYKNQDLLERLKKLSEKFSKRGMITLKHIYSHKKEPSDESEISAWQLNKKADQLVAIGIGMH